MREQTWMVWHPAWGSLQGGYWLDATTKRHSGISRPRLGPARSWHLLSRDARCFCTASSVRLTPAEHFPVTDTCTLRSLLPGRYLSSPSHTGWYQPTICTFRRLSSYQTTGLPTAVCISYSITYPGSERTGQESIVIDFVDTAYPRLPYKSTCTEKLGGLTDVNSRFPRYLPMGAQC